MLKWLSFCHFHPLLFPLLIALITLTRKWQANKIKKEFIEIGEEGE